MSVPVRLATGTKLLNVLGIAQLWQPIPMARTELSAAINDAFHVKLYKLTHFYDKLIIKLSAFICVHLR
jgi:hypothetical protein